MNSISILGLVVWFFHASRAGSFWLPVGGLFATAKEHVNVCLFKTTIVINKWTVVYYAGKPCNSTMQSMCCPDLPQQTLESERRLVGWVQVHSIRSSCESPKANEAAG